jgi:hypothetical protein
VSGDGALSARSQLADGPERPLRGLAIGERHGTELPVGGLMKGRGEHLIAGQLSPELPGRSLLTLSPGDGESACNDCPASVGCTPMVSLWSGV